MRGVEEVRRIDRIIKLYRPYIVENLYESEGYVFDRTIELSDGIIRVRMVVYVKRKRV